LSTSSSFKSLPDFSLEKIAIAPVAGLDEVGRGPLAGPVVAAAVAFNGYDLPEELTGIADSKALSAQKRADICRSLRAHEAEGGCWIGIGQATVEEIDRINILQASLLAMRRAFDALATEPAFALIDGNRLPELPCPAEFVVKGDTKSRSIAAASIIAKVARDRIMTELDRENPGYDWARNAGYPTPAHLDALAQKGASIHHRRSFGPVRAVLDRDRALGA
jgi:ribonuclease HII